MYQYRPWCCRHEIGDRGNLTLPLECDIGQGSYNRTHAPVAQGIEHRPSKPRVGGSRPPGRANAALRAANFEVRTLNFELKARHLTGCDPRESRGSPAPRWASGGGAPRELKERSRPPGRAYAALRAANFNLELRTSNWLDLDRTGCDPRESRGSPALRQAPGGGAPAKSRKGSRPPGQASLPRRSDDVAQAGAANFALRTSNSRPVLHALRPEGPPGSPALRQAEQEWRPREELNKQFDSCLPRRSSKSGGGPGAPVLPNHSENRSIGFPSQSVTHLRTPSIPAWLAASGRDGFLLTFQR
jgi:hypothetical protein